MASAKEDRVEGYLATISRLEPEVYHTDQSAWGTSLAISVKRLADQAEILNQNLSDLNELILQLTLTLRLIPEQRKS